MTATIRFSRTESANCFCERSGPNRTGLTLIHRQGRDTRTALLDAGGCVTQRMPCGNKFRPLATGQN